MSGRALIGGGAALIVSGGLLAFYLYGTSEFTQCFARFPSQGTAEEAARAPRDQGFGADVDGQRASVTFSSGETGEDAEEFVNEFQAIVIERDGRRAHPGSGCLERPHLN